MLRDQGRTYLDIAHILDLDGARTAHAAFNRARRQRSRAERAWLRGREVGRLDALASRMRGRHDLSVEKIVHRPRGLKCHGDSLSDG